MNEVRKLYKLSFKLSDGSIEKTSVSMLSKESLLKFAAVYLDSPENSALASIVTRPIITEEII